MGDFGHLTVCFAAVLSAAGGFLLLWRGADPRFFDAGRRLLYAAAAAAAVSLCALVFLLLSHDYRVSYVRDYADRTMSIAYLVAAVWGGKAGSLLVWAALQTWFTAAAAAWKGWRRAEIVPTALTVLCFIQLFFLLLVLFHSDPFEPLGATALQGIGLNPLLRNPYMAVHPPTLFVGFVGFSVPMAFTLAALAENRVDTEWLDDLRSWILFAWVFLSMGNLLGMIWAYEELGWGGYWGWDPVENASFMPWLTGTALLHSAMLEKRTGAFRVWNIVLVASTFILIIFGTFLTRSNVIQSVHTFAGSTTGPYLLGLIAACAVLTAAGLVMRWRALRGTRRIESLFSKEGIFLFANWAFVLSALFVLLATTAPLLTDLIRGEKAAVTPEFYNRWMVPLGLIILALIGLCIAINWKRQPLAQLARRIRAPIAVGILAGAGAAFYHGVPLETGALKAFVPVISFFLIGWIGALVVSRLSGLFSRLKTEKAGSGGTRRKIGGHLVHLAVVLLFIGFTGSAYTEEHQRSIGPGESIQIGPFRLDFLGLRTEFDFERNAIFADLSVKANGSAIGVLSPARYIYHSHPAQPTSEVVISSTLARDLFLILGQPDLRNGRATLHVLVNPLVAWIWIGGIVLVIGAVVAFAEKDLFENLRTRLFENRRPRVTIALTAGFVLAVVAAAWSVREPVLGVLVLLAACSVGMLLFVNGACHRLIAGKEDR